MTDEEKEKSREYWLRLYTSLASEPDADKDSPLAIAWQQILKEGTPERSL